MRIHMVLQNCMRSSHVCYASAGGACAGYRSRMSAHVAPLEFSSHMLLSTLTSSATGTRTCCMLSRSRNVTVSFSSPSCSVS